MKQTTLHNFISTRQLEVILLASHAEEKAFFIDKLIELETTINTMPKIYDQDGLGENAIAYLHYFTNSFDWYITERDVTDKQLQAFGLAIVHTPELGYISIQELIEHHAELDIHFTPTTLKVIKETK